MSGDSWELRQLLGARAWESEQIALSAVWESEQLLGCRKWENSQSFAVPPTQVGVWETVAMAKKDTTPEPTPEPEAVVAVPAKKRTVLASDAKKTTRPPKAGRRPCCP